MALFALGFAALINWFASMQYQATPRWMMRGVAIGLFLYAVWLFRYEPDRAWEIWWVGRAIANAAVRLVQTLIP